MHETTLMRVPVWGPHVRPLRFVDSFRKKLLVRFKQFVFDAWFWMVCRAQPDDTVSHVAVLPECQRGPEPGHKFWQRGALNFKKVFRRPLRSNPYITVDLDADPDWMLIQSQPLLADDVPGMSP